MFGFGASPAFGLYFSGDVMAGYGFIGYNGPLESSDTPTQTERFQSAGQLAHLEFGIGELSIGELVTGFDLGVPRGTLAGNSVSASAFDYHVGYLLLFRLNDAFLLKAGPMIAYTGILTSTESGRYQIGWSRVLPTGGVWTMLDWFPFRSQWGLADAVYLFASLKAQTGLAFQDAVGRFTLGIGLSSLGE